MRNRNAREQVLFWLVNEDCPKQKLARTWLYFLLVQWLSVQWALQNMVISKARTNAGCLNSRKDARQMWEPCCVGFRWQRLLHRLDSGHNGFPSWHWACDPWIGCGRWLGNPGKIYSTIHRKSGFLIMVAKKKSELDVYKKDRGQFSGSLLKFYKSQLWIVDSQGFHYLSTLFFQSNA